MRFDTKKRTQKSKGSCLNHVHVMLGSETPHETIGKKHRVPEGKRKVWKA